MKDAYTELWSEREETESGNLLMNQSKYECFVEKIKSFIMTIDLTLIITVNINVTHNNSLNLEPIHFKCS